MIMGPSCYSCIVNQVEKIIMLLGIDHESTGQKIILDCMGLIASLGPDLQPPVLARRVYDRINEHTGIADPYREIKKFTNDNALQFAPMAGDIISRSSSPVVDGMKISMAGNIIDYSTSGSGDLDVIEESLRQALEFDLDRQNLDLFMEDLDKAENILFIGDNSGEIVFDREFLKVLPREKITYAVRGGPVQNDATMDDARYIGLDKIVRVIDTGDATPGIDLSHLSQSFKETLQDADMVILKGQGNLETVYDADLSDFARRDIPLYFMLKIKCQCVSDLVEIKTGDIALLRRMS